MAWWEARARIPRGRLDAVSTALFALGASGLQEDHVPGQAPPLRQPWDTGPLPPPSAELIVKAWFEDPDRSAVAAALAPSEVAWEEVGDTDWSTSWQAAFRPIVISDRLVIAPPWDAPPGAIVVEPGAGFGTGDHPTTQQALRALDALADGCRTALDVGCGSGVLAIAAARLGLRVRGIDVDAAAIDDSRANAARNGMSLDFSLTPVDRVREPVDLVLANLHAELLERLGDDLVRLTGRWLVVAGVLTDREHRVHAVFDHRLRRHAREVDGDWVSLVYAR